MKREGKHGTANGNCLPHGKRWMTRLSAAGVLAGMVVAGAWGFDPVATPVGLKGLFPAKPPAELSADAVSALPESWKQWGVDTTAAVADLYSAEGDVPAQRQKLDAVKRKLKVIDEALKDSRYSRIHNLLMGLKGSLTRRVALAEATLETLEVKPESVLDARLRSKAAAVSTALRALESDLRGIPGGSAWLTYVKAAPLQQSLIQGPAGESLTKAEEATKAKIAKRKDLNDAKQKEFLNRPAFVRLESALEEHLAALQWTAQAANPEALRTALAKLLAAVDAHADAPQSSQAQALREALVSLRQSAPDGGDRLAAVVEREFLNDNVRIVASEKFLSRLLSDSRYEQGQVNDFILGASVGGWQTTATSVNIDLKPASDRVRFELLLDGTVQTNTAGSTSQATVYTSGYHTFHAQKEVSYDGIAFRTLPGTIGVNANNTTTGARTRVSGLPIFGGIADRVALREANDRRPQAEAIARSRIEGRVLPRFNEEADRQFAEATRQIDRDLNAGLKQAGLYPDRQHYESTDSQMRFSSRLTGDKQLAGSAPDASLLNIADGVRLLLHDSAVNNAIDRIDLAGKTMTEEEFRHHLEKFLSKALSRTFKFRAPGEVPGSKPATADDADDKTPAKIAFASADPLRVRFVGGQVVLVIRAGIEREGKDPIPAQEISVPLTISVEGSQIVISRGDIDITGIDKQLSPAENKVVNARIGSALPDRKQSATIEIPGANNRRVMARITSIQAVDGWIAVSAQ